ncbi:MAG: Glu/Leu/Phe/Val dehydrogenase dimerization domain-containing protein [Pseudomonadota bacterium]
MTVFSSPAFDDHEAVHFCADQRTGLRAIVAIHSTHRGPAAGGCRIWEYATEADAIVDVLRLARGMSYKNAMAGLDLGGGKAVVLKSPGNAVTDAQLTRFGDFVDSLGGRYITAEDVGMSVEKMQLVARGTKYVAGLPPREGIAGGDPSPKTALGVYHGMRAAIEKRLGRESLADVRVAVQGVGHVGLSLCEMLHAAGAQLWVADIDASRVAEAVARFGATAVPLDAILEQDVDVVAPCALGGILNADSISRLRASVVAGAANNQLADDVDGQRLHEHGVLYCPDYVINAGGIINVACEYEGEVDDATVNERVVAIADRLREVFARAEATAVPTNRVADQIARDLIARSG